VQQRERRVLRQLLLEQRGAQWLRGIAGRQHLAPPCHRRLQPQTGLDGHDRPLRRLPCHRIGDGAFQHAFAVQTLVEPPAVASGEHHAQRAGDETILSVDNLTSSVFLPGKVFL
jgi:hypothetical protein